MFRDLVGANMLTTGATVEEVAARLWHMDPYSTTVKYYIGGYNASDAVAALEDVLAALAAYKRPISHFNSQVPDS
jgi:hypothetical protein